MEDIEDLCKNEFPYQLKFNYYEINPKIKRRVKKNLLNDGQNDTLLQGCDSYIPGTQKIYIKTWGCSHNNSDSEYMAGQLASYGYKIVDEKEDADLWLLNSCTVKNPAEDHFRNAINLANKLDKKIVVAGCVSQGSSTTDYLKNLSIIGVHQIDRVIEVVEETLKGNTVKLLKQKKSNHKKMGGASLSLPKIRKNPLIEIIPISTGCLNQCTYCKTKHARGELGSYTIDEIVERAKQSFEEGVSEIWLTSEDTGAYGLDIGVNLPQLLNKLVEVIPANCRLRLGMTNPPYILDCLEEISKIMLHPCIYSFIHIPVQSGSDNVLGDMRREYTVANFCKVVDTLVEKVPGITVATDIICGFPTETEEDFGRTLSLCQKYKFPSLFINQFYPRPGTPAAKLPRIPTKIVKDRTRRLSSFFQSYKPYEHKLGEKQSVLVTEVSHDSLYYVGHNKFYEQVLIPKLETILGKIVDVEIIETGKHFMKGKLCTSAPQEQISIKVSYSDLAYSIILSAYKKSLFDTKDNYMLYVFFILFITVVVRIIWISFKYTL